MAQWTGFIHTYMANITGTSTGATINFSLTDNSSTNTSSDFNKNQVVDSFADTLINFSQRHYIDIIINNHIGGWKPLLHGLNDWITIPSGHDWRRHQCSR